jgi:hypothetical protein
MSFPVLQQFHRLCRASVRAKALDIETLPQEPGAELEILIACTQADTDHPFHTIPQFRTSWELVDRAQWGGFVRIRTHRRTHAPARGQSPPPQIVRRHLGQTSGETGETLTLIYLPARERGSALRFGAS